MSKNGVTCIASLAAVVVISVASIVSAQQKSVKIALTTSSTLASADIVKDMSKQCPNTTITLDLSKADYMLEAGGEGRTGNGEFVKYKFTLFNHDGDAVYSTSTLHLGNAVKDVCSFIKKKN